MKKRGTRGLSITIPICALVAACGGAPPPAQTPATTVTTQAESTKIEPTDAVVAEQAPKAETTPVTTPAAAIEAAEPCPNDSICLRVPFDGKGKIEKRTTRLLGDPKIEQTWSQNIDSKRSAKFDAASTPVEIILRHPPSKPGQHLAQLTLKMNGREVMLDRHENEEFSFVSIIAAEKEGDSALLVDIRYMK